MIHFPRLRLFATLALLAFAALAIPAHADGDVVCSSGTQSEWKPLPDLRRRAWQEGWTVQEVQIADDCYEVYARTEAGQAIEAFFHPVTLEKLVVFRRGREIFRKRGFTG